MSLLERATNDLKPIKAVDHRKWFYCRSIKLDPGLAKRGLDRILLMIMISQVIMVVCPFVSIFMSGYAKLRLENVRSFLLESMGVLALFNEYSCRQNLSRFYGYLDEFMSSPRALTVNAKEILEQATKTTHDSLLFFFRVFTINYFVMVISQPLGELLQGNSWKKLPYPWVFPPSNTELSFWLVCVFQVPSLLISHFLGVVIMSFSSITVQSTALFDVLLLSIRDLENKNIADYNESDSPNYRSSLLSCLRSDIALHQQLFKELISVTPYLRNTFFILSVTISMVMACEAYPIVTGNFTGGELIKGLSFLFVQVVCWAQMCLKMETMADKNTEVFDAFYNTPWYSSGTRYKKLLLTALTNSRRPMYIKSKIFRDMNATMSTFYSFVVSAFNMLNLIRKMN